MARSLNSEAKTSCAQVIKCSSPRTFRKVSCCPANDASGRSSAVAEERTATANSSAAPLASAILRQDPSISFGRPLRKGRVEHPAAYLSTDDREPLHVIDVERRQGGPYALIQSVLREKIAICIRGRCEAAGHGHAESRQAGNHFADGGVLAADKLDVLILQLLEGNDVGLHSSLLVG